jgi:diacylglycerol kinase (ATP)
MRIELIINGSDGSALEELRDAATWLRREGHEVRASVTFEAGDASRLAREAALREADLVLGVGGDGTVSEVVNGLLGRGRELPRAAALPAMGVIPLGTANDLATWLGVPGSLAEAVRATVSAPRIEADVGRVNDRFFINVSTGGFGADATEEAAPRTKRALGSLAYVATGVRKLVSLTPSAARFWSEGELLYDGEFLLFAVGNGARTGGGNRVAPLARLDDGLLDLCLVPAMGSADFLRLLPEIRSGEHAWNPRVLYRQLPDLRVEPLRNGLSVNADGEPVEGGRFDYAVAGGAIHLAWPHPDTPDTAA